jgi:hypothetical protein
MTTAATVKELALSNEIKELDIEYIRIFSEEDKRQIIIKRCDLDSELRCEYCKKGKDTAKSIQSTLVNSGFEDRKAKKFIAHFLKLLIKFEQEQKQTQRDHILGQIRERRKKTNIKTVEQWKTELQEKHDILRQVVQDNIPEMWVGLEFELSILGILNLHDKTLPFIGLFLARPGSYKTQMISLLQDWYCTYYTDDFTAKSFVSHSTAVTEEELEEIDMLPRIKNRLFLTPELAPIFTVKEEDLVKTLGIITRLADGHGYKSNSGAHGQRGYGSSTDSLMFTWLGAVVDIPYRVYKLLGNLGFKIYFFRLPFKESTEEDLLTGMTEDFNSKISNIRTALYEYLFTFELGPHLVYDTELNKVKWNISKDNPDAKRYIVRLSMLLQHLRCIVSTWNTEGSQGSGYNYTVSQPEDPKRAIRSLYNLARGHALLTGRNYITLEDVPIVVKTVLSTAMIERVGALNLLINNGGRASTDDVMDYLHVTRPTALRTMTELRVIQLVDEFEVFDEPKNNWIKHTQLKEEFNWFLTPQFDGLREGFQPVDNREFMEDKRRPKKEGTNKENYTPYSHLTEEQVNEFLSTSDQVEKEQEEIDNSTMEIDKHTVGGEVLRQRLVETGKFNQEEAVVVIDLMLEHGTIEKVSYDTYRRKRN